MKKQRMQGGRFAVVVYFKKTEMERLRRAAMSRAQYPGTLIRGAALRSVGQILGRLDRKQEQQPTSNE